MRYLLTTLLSLFLLFSSATATFAQSKIPDSFKDPTVSAEGTISGGFVPCSGVTCDLCSFMVMANTIIKWLFGMAFILFMFLAVKAGIKLVIEGNPAALKAAKESFQNAFIGLIIFLCAWLIVDTLLHALLKGGTGEIDGWGPWTQVKCTKQADSTRVKEGEKPIFKGDAPWEPGKIMDPSKAAAYTGGSLPQCPTSNPYCSVAALKAAGFSDKNANIMSCLAMSESTGNPAARSNKSTACGLFQVIKGTWESAAIGACRDFSKCSDAKCNINTTFRLVNSSGFTPWTCPNCNNKAQHCINQYGG
jgi:hypothetical protein